jgi:hypothetical protein
VSHKHRSKANPSAMRPCGLVTSRPSSPTERIACNYQVISDEDLLVVQRIMKGAHIAILVHHCPHARSCSYLDRGGGFLTHMLSAVPFPSSPAARSPRDRSYVIGH